MPQVNPDCFHQSASSIGAFKKCPTLWRLLYREGLRPADDTESQRVGTNWHAMHETYANGIACQWKDHWTIENNKEQWEAAKEYALEQVVDHLNEQYNIGIPANKTAFEWGMERQILLTCFIGYLWYWQEDQIQFLHSELPFELPIHAPKVGLPLPMSQVVRVGKIDHIIKWQGMVGPLERKSTTRSIAPDSDYWDKGKKDTQVSMYALAMRDMAHADTLPDAVNKALYGNDEQRTESPALPLTPSGSLGSQPSEAGDTDAAGEASAIVCDKTRVLPVPRKTKGVHTIPSSESSDQIVSDRVGQGGSESDSDLGGNTEVRHPVCQLPLVPARERATRLNFGNCLYDVWHRPTIKPKMLTQADTAAFVASGMYLDQKYEVVLTEAGVTVDGEVVEVEQGKKGYAIKESIAMYGARLLADIYERPDFYFARREIVRTDAELRKFRGTLYSIYQCQKTMADTGHFYEDESQCRATFPCPMIPICYGPGADAVCDGKTTPNGFKRIFVDLMVNGEVLDAE